jgi:hypothetical protein
MILIPIIIHLAEINTYNYTFVTILFPYKLRIPLLSKTSLISHGHIFKSNITHVYIISHKLIHINVNLPNNPPNIKFSSLRPNLNPIMIIKMLLVQPISKFIDHPIHSLIHNV